jgi:hypothetical protein
VPYLPIVNPGAIMSTLLDDELQEPASDAPPEETEDKIGLKFLDADVTDFIKGGNTAVAKEYTKKAQSLLGLALRMTVEQPETVADAATIIAFGDGLASVTGELAEADEHVRTFIDAILTPSSPWLAFLAVGIPFTCQLFRNHEVPVRRIRIITIDRKIPFSKKHLRFKVPLHVRLPKRIRATTTAPNTAAESVFSNPKIIAQLKKKGIDVAWPPAG